MSKPTVCLVVEFSDHEDPVPQVYADASSAIRVLTKRLRKHADPAYRVEVEAAITKMARWSGRGSLDLDCGSEMFVLKTAIVKGGK